MRKVLGLISTSIALTICTSATLAQQSQPKTIAKGGCDSEVGSYSGQFRRQTKIAHAGAPRITLVAADSKRKSSACGLLTGAMARRSSETTPIDPGAVRMVVAPLSFYSPAAKPDTTIKSERENGTSSDSTQGPAQAQGGDEAQELAKKLSNPVASLISFPMQSNFDFKMGTGSGWRYTLNVQPVIPFKLNENWNMISRTIIPIIHQGNVTGPNMSQSGLGDTVQSLFFSPNKTEPLIWAIGPVFLFPTATDASLGSQKWGVGPTALALKQKQGWTYGMLANHIWSVAGKSNRADVNATFMQPFLSYSNKQAWTYGVNTEATYDWNGHSWSLPLNLSISKLVRFGKQPVSFGGGPKCWVTTPAGGPEGCGLRIVVTALFPKK
jgi:hypothetical protein